MANEPENIPNPSEYAQRLVDTLEANRREQADITSQMTRLQNRLNQLRVHESWLAETVQAVLPGADAPAEIEPAAGESDASPVAGEEQPGSDGSTPPPAETAAEAPRAVPPPRQADQADTPAPPSGQESGSKAKSPAKKTTAKKTTAKKTTKETAAKKSAAKKTTAKETTSAEEATAAKGTAKKPDEPPLHQLILALLLKTPGEPRQAREVFDDLSARHPGRAASVQVVRNNLEALANKNTIEKSKQGSSVMYTAYAAGNVAGAEGGQVSETAGEKVPAEV